MPARPTPGLVDTAPVTSLPMRVSSVWHQHQRRNADMNAPRLKNVAMTAAPAVQALQSFTAAVDNFGLPTPTIDLVHLRASQINGCSVCTDLHSREAKNHGEREERLHTLAA